MQTKRKQWRTLYELFNREEEIDPSEDTNFKLNLIKQSTVTIESEIRTLCKQTYKTARYFASVAKSDESRCFYSCIIADQFRYLR